MYGVWISKISPTSARLLRATRYVLFLIGIVCTALLFRRGDEVEALCTTATGMKIDVFKAKAEAQGMKVARTGTTTPGTATALKGVGFQRFTCSVSFDEGGQIVSAQKGFID